MKKKVEKLNREHAPSLVRLSPPELEEKHLAGRYQSCFEYYWMSPPLSGSYSTSEHAMADALDRLRSKNKEGGTDVRVLVQDRLKDFNPFRDPAFRVMDDQSL